VKIEKVRIFLIIWVGKIIATLSRFFNLGAGETWPGEIGMRLDKNLIKKLISGIKKGVILVAGTNGKTTTVKMIKTILYATRNTQHATRIVCNQSGANLLNGIASTLISAANILGKVRADWAIFEVDEATLPLTLKEFTPKIVVILNLFRDQLDRYGEIDLIAKKWHQALKKLPNKTTVILNADDPQIAALGKDFKAKVLYFGLNEQSLFLEKVPHSADSTYCLFCGEKLKFKGVYFSHLGIWHCQKCGWKRPKVSLSSWQWPLIGVYNQYNTLAAVLVGRSLGVNERAIRTALKNFKPAFGRGEEFEIRDKRVKILLSKNPTGFNATIRRLIESRQRFALLALNDRIPDGRDVSWIWDVDFEELVSRVDQLIITGDRAYDLGLRLKYATKAQNSKLKAQNYNLKLKITEDLKESLRIGLEKIKQGETLYILPTYSAMLEIRKYLAGRSIL